MVQEAYEPKLAVQVLALAEAYDLPNTAATCEHCIAECLRNRPHASLQSVSPPACLRIIRALGEQLGSASAEMHREGHKLPDLPSVNTMLGWR